MKYRCSICKRQKETHRNSGGSKYCVHCWETIGKEYNLK
ncbi:DNA-directed RNA polymerase subunit RPC12/RpoP [Bacillus iocasae]|uniref:DNA-directed RNA polymerase subunit RPC12/RpoP n=1 Tax=Priestia iocasae TaxID=2291674 RepID=A0ABS2QZ89_9BACI|nr:DNA-directed RNA polymerase subunit RPC12/RpoP [Metabacillus iocasae]